MSCSQYGYEKPYSSYPQVQTSFYKEPSTNDNYNNLTNQTAHQAKQLHLNSMMPASWNSQTAVQSATSSYGDDWTRYSVNQDNYQRYISASGATRITQLARPNTSKFGTPNLLRSQPPTSLASAQCFDNGNWTFNDSSDRLALVNPAVQSYIGCGNY